MPATGGIVPTLSQVRNWDTEHLTEAAVHWTKTATVWEDCFTRLTTQIACPGGVPWEGEAAEAAQAMAYSDRMTVIGLADQLHSASAIARSGAGELKEAQRAVLRVVDVAESAGFTVGEDFSVTDPNYYDAVTAAARQAQAEALAGELRATVGVLMAADTRIAGSLTSATTGLGSEVFPESGGAPNRGGEKPNEEVKLVDYVTHAENPIRPGEPIDPTNRRIGDQRFGYWEDVPLPYKPWLGEQPPPLTREYREFSEDIRQNMAAAPSEFFVPNKSWAFDNEAPYAQLQEQYKIRISGTEATPYSQVIDKAGVPTQQRWMQYTYEVAHSRQVVLGGDVEVKGQSGDIAGLGPFRWRSEDWTPWSFDDIAKLSSNNPTVQFYIPDGCGGQFTYNDAVPGPVPWSGVPSTPIMTRPR